MRAVGAIIEPQLTADWAEKLELGELGRRSVGAEPVAEIARRVVLDRFGTEVYSSGILVTTSMRAADQPAALAAVQRGVMALEACNPWRGPQDQIEQPQADGAALDSAIADGLRGVCDEDLLRVAVVLSASSKAMRVQLADGKRLRLQGAGLQPTANGQRPTGL
jgi:penicillin-binding protein 1A